MMYSSKLAVALKTDGKVLRELGDTVYLPFGSEYSILVKNLNVHRASVKITIDGQDIADGSSFIVDAGCSLDIERFVKNASIGNRFKFIKRTQNIENHRGIGISDGIITVEFQFEQPRPFHIYPTGMRGGIWPATKGPSLDDNVSFDSIINTTYKSYSCSDQKVKSEVGITVPGSISTQQFTTVAPLNLQSEKFVMVIRILGETEVAKVEEPLTVDKKKECKTCGKLNPVKSNFCAECGTSLKCDW